MWINMCLTNPISFQSNTQLEYIFIFLVSCNLANELQMKIMYDICGPALLLFLCKTYHFFFNSRKIANLAACIIFMQSGKWNHCFRKVRKIERVYRLCGIGDELQLHLSIIGSCMLQMYSYFYQYFKNYCLHFSWLFTYNMGVNELGRSGKREEKRGLPHWLELKVTEKTKTKTTTYVWLYWFYLCLC